MVPTFVSDPELQDFEASVQSPALKLPLDGQVGLVVLVQVSDVPEPEEMSPLGQPVGAEDDAEQVPVLEL